MNAFKITGKKEVKDSSLHCETNWLIVGLPD